MIEVLGQSQQALLQLLLKRKGGMTVDELATQLDITRNAVRQHLAALSGDGLVATGARRPSGGRPQQLYVLTERGREAFPRQYSWFAELVVETILGEVGAAGLHKRLVAMGARVAEKLRRQHAPPTSRQRTVELLARIMQELGYSTGGAPRAGQPVIEADNCVFHNLAMKNPDICEFDLALLGKFTDSKVEHQECMARSGNVCRFKFLPKAKV